jgi:hypothetical protein
MSFRRTEPTPARPNYCVVGLNSEMQQSSRPIASGLPLPPSRSPAALDRESGPGPHPEVDQDRDRQPRAARRRPSTSRRPKRPAEEGLGFPPTGLACGSGGNRSATGRYRACAATLAITGKKRGARRTVLGTIFGDNRAANKNATQPEGTGWQSARGGPRERVKLASTAGTGSVPQAERKDAPQR